ncbi:MAG: 2-succinylbenzoate-CoA ligase, partial [Chlamydiae bacterium]|nr:2-succinylbenzoate-CoA ligase [Chlamydiota bacterium]
ENIQPEEIEDILLAHPDVIEAIVIQKTDPEFGFRPVALIRAAKAINPASLSAFLGERLPKFKIPKQFFFVDDFARNGMKIDRMKIMGEIETSPKFRKIRP